MIIPVIPAGKGFQGIVTEHLYLWRQLTADDLHHVVSSKPFIKGLDRF